MAFVNDSDSPVFNARGNHLAPCFSVPENIHDFFRQSVGSKIPVLGLFSPQHIPHRASNQADLSAPGVKQCGGFFEYRVNGYQSKEIIALSTVFLYTKYRKDLTQRRKGAKNAKEEKEGVVYKISVEFHSMLPDKNPFSYLGELCVFASFA
jgi:hypothetical protein